MQRPNLEPGGWYFEYQNDFYPDIDDTAMVLLALKKISLNGNREGQAAVDRGMRWLLGMQSKDGGWASFDVDNTKRVLCHVPFADHNAMIDPPSADITARILEMLAAYGYDRSNRFIRKAVDFVLSLQEEDGSWFGRWGVNYVYGTWQAIKGLVAIGLSTNDPAISAAASWLLAAQNRDGGWGETCASYDNPDERGNGPSTASQTAWGVMGLMFAGMEDCSAVRKGIDFLVNTQNADGTWDEEQWTGTGFPTVFYLRYHLYRHSFPVWALGMYKRYQECGISGLCEPATGRVVI